MYQEATGRPRRRRAVGPPCRGPCGRPRQAAATRPAGFDTPGTPCYSRAASAIPLPLWAKRNCASSCWCGPMAGRLLRRSSALAPLSPRGRGPLGRAVVRALRRPGRGLALAARRSGAAAARRQRRFRRIHRRAPSRCCRSRSSVARSTGAFTPPATRSRRLRPLAGLLAPRPRTFCAPRRSGSTPPRACGAWSCPPRTTGRSARRSPSKACRCRSSTATTPARSRPSRSPVCRARRGPALRLRERLGAPRLLRALLHRLCGPLPPDLFQARPAPGPSRNRGGGPARRGKRPGVPRQGGGRQLPAHTPPGHRRNRYCAAGARRPARHRPGRSARWRCSRRRGARTRP